MNNYFRITTYHPAEDLSVIADSNGKFEKLWQFSAYMVAKGFKIIAVGGENKFNYNNLPKIDYENRMIIIRAYKVGKPEVYGNNIIVNGRSYSLV